MSETKEHTNPGPEEVPSGSGLPVGWIVMAICMLSIAVTAGFYWISTHPIQRVEFAGHHFVSPEELQDVEIPMGMHPDSMNFGRIINEFEQIPFVKRADMNVEPGGKLVVQVTERQPVAMLADGANHVFIDRYGIQLPRLFEKEVDVPILYGFTAGSVGDTLTSEAYTSVAAFLMELHKNPISNASISELVWSEPDGVVALTSQNGVKLIFGTGDYAERLRNWEAFYGEVVRKKGIENIRSVDLRFKGQIVAREQ